MIFFSMLISTTPWSVRKLQWFMLDKFKSERPDLAEKELWQFVIVSRMNVKLMTVDYPKDYGSSPLSKDEINCIVNNAKSIAEKYHNFDQVVDYLVELDYKENRFNDPSGILDRLNRLLES